MNTPSSILLRLYLREPVHEIEAAASCLELAAAAHIAGQSERAAQLIDKANDPTVRNRTESIWGKGSKFSASGPFNSTPAFLSGLKERMPSLGLQRELHQRDEFYCRFCGIP